MTGLTDYMTNYPWVEIFTLWYVLVDDAYQVLFPPARRLRRRGPVCLFSDSEVITVALVIDAFFHGNEALGLAFLRQYHLDLFPHLLDNSRFNRRRRALIGVMEAIRQRCAARLISADDPLRLVDSAPVPLCTYTRGWSCASASGPEYASVIPARRARLFGLRLYLTTTDQQIVDRWMLAPAAHKEGKLTPALLEDVANLWVLGDNAYHDPGASDWLKRQRNITLTAMQRRDTRQPRWPAALRRWLNRLRRRIESALSVLSTVFFIETPGSRSLAGLVARTATRILAYTLSFLTCIYLKTGSI